MDLAMGSRSLSGFGQGVSVDLNCRGTLSFGADTGEYERRHNGGVRLDDKTRRSLGELFPCDLFVGSGTAVASVTCGRVRNLAEVAP